jgi:GxxExxY protein
MAQMNAEERDQETHAIIGAAMEVHSRLGHGFLESVYQEALALEFGLRGITFEQQFEARIVYRGDVLHATFRLDFVCFESVIVELKALKNVSPSDDAQCINYLKATGLGRCLLVNFGAPRLEFKRLVLSNRDYHNSKATLDSSS